MNSFPPLLENIQLGYRHQIHFTSDLFSPSNPLLRSLLESDSPLEPPRVLVVLDLALAKAHPGLVQQIKRYFKLHAAVMRLVAQPLPFQSGESAKNNPSRLLDIYRHIERHRLCRHSYIVALGGGSLLDLVGFAASTAHRGIRLIRMPSTLLAQADAGVGVKNGVNLFKKKNFVGSFAVPYAVINDFSLLKALPDSEKRSGLIEAIKVALIRDASFFNFLEARAADLAKCHPPALHEAICRSARLHVEHIARGGDPFEWGTSRPLDFGHWAAHKLEQLSGFRIAHGPAVAIGMALDLHYSALTGHLQTNELQRIFHLFRRLGLPLFAPELLQKDKRGHWLLLQGLEEFREHLGGQLSITLLREIGKGFDVHQLEKPLIRRAAELLSKEHPIVSTKAKAKAPRKVSRS